MKGSQFTPRWRSKKRPVTSEFIQDKFYRWFDFRHPEKVGLIVDNLTRRDLRDAYEEGYRRAQKDARK